MSQPLFLLGAPRSGTTFLCHTLNQHPDIALTNESRIFVLIKDFLEDRCARADLLEPYFTPQLRAFARAHAGAWVETFYRQALGNRARIWGDTHTSYGDPSVLSGRHRGVMAEPCSGSCLELILACLPDAKFIHLHRHPWQVATSLRSRGWVGSRREGLLVWRQHVTEIGRFFVTLPESQQLTLSYPELIEHPEEIAAEIGAFLGLGTAEPIARFLAGQRDTPTHFSSPTTDLRDALSVTPGERGRAALAAIADAAELLGYACK